MMDDDYQYRLRRQRALEACLDLCPDLIRALTRWLHAQADKTEKTWRPPPRKKESRDH